MSLARRLSAPGGRVRALVFLSCLAAAVNVLESLLLPLPRSIAWVRVGLANAVTLAALVLFDLKSALIVVFARTFLGSLFRGAFLSIGHLFSLAGALGGALVMWGIRRSSGDFFSPVGLSAAGGFSSSLLVFGIAWALAPAPLRTGLSYLFPLVLAFGLAGGIVTGFAARALLAALGVKTVDTGSAR